MRVAQSASIESYDTRTQWLLAEQRVRYASLSFAQEQRRLRIHLRRFLLLNDAAADVVATESLRSVSTSTPTPHHCREWREEAISRERDKLNRHASAQAIQRSVRRWLVHRSDVELPSTSEWVVVVASSAPQRMRDHSVDDSSHTDGKRARQVIATHDTELPPTPPTLNEPFQVIIELLGARDLALSSQRDPVEIVADVQLVHGPANDVLVLGVLEAVCVASSSEEIAWDNQVLQLGIDSPDRVLREGAVHVDVFSQTSTRVALGRLTVALDLLETPLADKFAMTRWFPLERGRSGGNAVRQVKGEIRLGIRLLKRNPRRNQEGGDVWIPYEAPPTPPSPVPPRQAFQRAHPTKRAPPSKPPLSPRKHGPQSAASPRGTTKPQSSRGPYARVEAMSPPSSPSSYSSDSYTEFSPPKHTVCSLSRAPQRRSSSGGIVGSSRQKKASSGTKSSGDEDPAPHDETMDQSSRPHFLKRKPYKVVFQKLDWSRVGSKTDSNWGSGGKTTRATGSSPSRRTSTATPPDHAPQIAATRTTDALSAISERIAAVAQQVYAACHVTTATAPLAQMRYKSERTKWLHQICPPTTTPTRSTITQDTLRALWTELHGDPLGVTYVARLQQKHRLDPLPSPASSTCT